MTSVCAAVILRSGMVLLARRAPGRKGAGKWEFPGGRIEPGESPAAALKRELKEELNIEAEVGPELARSRHAGEHGSIELIAFLVPRFTGEIALADHDRLAWTEASKLLTFDLLPADRPIAEVVQSHRRRRRYKGKNPRRFEEKYKELDPRRWPEAAEKAKARGSTPAGAHVPVMLKEVLSALEPLEGAAVLDCTLGWGGHAEALSRRVGPSGTVIGLDRDLEELARAESRLRSLGLSMIVRHADYADALGVLEDLQVPGVDALLADLGVSSMQLDRPERGLSFKADGPLDMRMDRSRGKTAADWLASATEREIAEALERYGQEPDARAVAASLASLAARDRSPKTTRELASAVSQAKGLGPGRVLKKDAFSSHPAARTFQALRIVVNGEHESLRRLLEDLPSLVRRGGRAAVITFHSGEEALVARVLREQAARGKWVSPPDEPLRPSPDEVRANPRSRSARLWRVVRA